MEVVLEKEGFSSSQNSVVPHQFGKAFAADGTTIIMPGKVEFLAPAGLMVRGHQTRKHSRRQIKALIHLIRRYGFVVPILVDQDTVVITGQARVQAAREMGLQHIPAIRLTHLTEPEVRALRIADNRLTELSSWDRDTLAREIIELQELHIELPDLSFSVPEIDLLLDEQIPKPANRTLNDCPPADRTKPAISRSGDIWRCGPHKLACGDVRNNTLVSQLMERELAQMVCSDPPYNVPVPGHVSGLGRHAHQNFVMASGEMTDDEFVCFLTAVLEAQATISRPGSLHYMFMDWLHLEHLYAARKAGALEKFQHCVWAKTNGGMGSFYRSQTEHVVVLRKPGAPHINNVELGRYGRNRTNLWTYAGANSFDRERRKELGLHPTVKNAEMIADAIKDCTRPDDIVFDGFLGSGTTMIAAEDTRRRCYATEIDPYYCDTALHRYAEFTADEPLMASSGLTFAQVKAQREAQPEPDGVEPRGDNNDHG